MTSPQLREAITRLLQGSVLSRRDTAVIQKAAYEAYRREQ